MNLDLREPAQVNLLDEREVMLHMRALLDLHDLLLNGFDTEMSNFRKKLISVGWGKDRLNEVLQKAAQWTRYEYLIDSPDFGKKTH